MNKNEYRVLNLIFNNNKISSGELAEKLAISNAAVSKILKKLKNENYIIEQKNTISVGKGRPKKLMRIKNNDKKIIGVNLGADFIDLSICYLDGEIIESFRKKFFLKRKESLVELLLSELETYILKYNKEYIVGIGLALNGIVDTKKNISIYSPYFKWKSFKIGEIVEQKFNIPVIVDNDVRAMLNAEKIFGEIKDLKNLFYLYIKKGIGSSIMIDNRIYEGSNSHSGEVGHFTINENTNKICKCGKSGCFETEFSETAIRFLLQSEYEKVSKANYLDDKDMIEIYKSAKEDKIVEKVVSNVSFNLGKVIGNIMNVLDIEDIVIAGDIIYAEDIFTKNFEKGMKKLLSPNFNSHIRIHHSKLKDMVEKKGAVSLVMKNLFANLKLIK